MRWRGLKRDDVESKKAVFADISRYKYELTEDYTHEILICKGKAEPITFTCPRFTISLSENEIFISKGFRWDGNSAGIETGSFIEGALVHDGLCLLMRSGKLAVHPYRDLAHQELMRICIANGMYKIRAKFHYLTLKYFGKKATEGDG